MANKATVRKFFTKKKMDNLDHENLPEQPTEPVEQAEEVVEQFVEESEVPEAEVKSGSPCPECNGTGLRDAGTLCSNCEGSGQV